MTDQLVSHYVAEATRHPPTRDQLDHARIAYQQRLLQECWGFDDLGARLRRLFGLLRANQRVVDVRGADAMDALEKQTFDEVVSVAGKFQRQLQSLYREDRIPEDDDHLQDRLRKASAYFTGKLEQGLLPWLRALSFETDNKALRKTLRQAVDELRKVVAIKNACLASCRERFSTPAYLGALGRARIDTESMGPLVEKGLDARPGDAESDGLLAALGRWRARKAEEEERDGVTRYRVLTRAVLRQIADTLPDGPEALATVRGIGKPTVERYGEEILGIVSDYCRGHGIDAAALPRPGQQRTGKAGSEEGNTRLISYRLHQEGLSIEEIASRRSLKPNTIEGHLAYYIRTGKLAVTDVISNEKLAKIAAVLAETGTDELALAKQALGEGYSYGELKMVQAHLARDLRSR